MFFSKRNQVYPILRPEGIGVEKHFADPADWQWEAALYEQMQCWSGCARLLETRPGVTITGWHSGGTLLDELLRQETDGFRPEVWEALADWIPACLHRCGNLPQDGNLRNFLWSGGHIIGIDLESYGEITVDRCAAEIIACLLHYDPENTPVKSQAAALLQQRLGISNEMVSAAEQTLLQRRSKATRKSISGIILAGGRSSRMGQDKAQLLLGQETMLQRQIRKLQALGITDILVSGAAAPAGCRSIPDIYPDRGPLGGLHACLKAAENAACLVVSVDVPLVPVSILDRLGRTHRQGILALSHGDRQEPLVAVYEKEVYRLIEPLILRGGAPVRQLAQLTDWNTCPYNGPADYLHNCNTPADYTLIQNTLESFSRQGLEFL